MRNLVLVLLLLTAFARVAVARPARPAVSVVPEWARRAVWYQIFPERFRNGDARNDPRLEDQRGSWPHDQTQPWQVHPWTADWYALAPYEKANGKDIWFNLQRRRYGGDLQGVLDALDYLQDLGVTAIYLNPVFASPSSHKYDTYAYQHIDPNFGPDPDGDRRRMATETPDDPSTWHWTAADRLALRLVAEVHRRGMRIVFDGVFNHVGMTSPFFTDVVRNQQASRFRDWFVVKSYDDAAVGTKFDYEGWFGVKELPNWRQDANGLVEGPRDYVFAVTRRWMAPNGKVANGIDGWRLDVAFCVRHPFWKAWCALVRAINPQAYVTAEIIDTVAASKPYLERDEFDAVMNYNFAFTAGEFFYGGANAIKPTAFDARLRDLRAAYRPEVAYGMMNLLGSHDTARLATHIVNADQLHMREWGRYCDLSRAGNNPRLDTRCPNAHERRLQRLAVLFQMTYVGAPMIYYGDEVGMWGGNDPCDRKPMIWKHPRYADEATLPDQSKRETPDTVSVDEDLLAFYRKCIHIRNAHLALQVGDYRTVTVDDKTNVFAFLRRSGCDQVLVVLHNAAGAVRVPVPAGAWRDGLNGGAVKGTVRLEGWQGAVLVR